MSGPILTARRQSGLSYVEVMLAAVILGISVMPITDALQTSMQVARQDIRATANHYRLLGMLESLLAEPFSTLSAQALGSTTPSTYSDPVATPERRLVFIAAYDGDNADGDNNPFTGTETDLLWLRVEIEGKLQALASLKTAP